MIYKIDKESTSKNLHTDSLNIEGDNINMGSNPFEENPASREKEELGMEFLVDKNSEEGEEGGDQEGGDQEDEEEGGDFDPFLEGTQEQDSFQQPQKSYEDIQNEKSYYLSQLKRLAKKGSAVSRRFTMEHSLEEIRGEVLRIKKEEEMDSSIDYCRQGLMFCVSTIEMADGKYNFGANLGGWSQNVMGNIETYDSVFEELYEKYSSSIGVSPEIKLISMLAGSAFMHSLQKKMLSGTSAPPPRQREMQGPEVDTEELMRKLSEIDVDVEDTESDSGSESVKITEETKKINVKKPRGRPPKK